MPSAYSPRRIRFVELREAHGWRLKLYTILHEERESVPELLAAAADTAFGSLPRPAVTPDRYGVGILSVHRGSSYDFVTVSYWCYETELRSHAFMRPSSGSYLLEPVTSSELSSDVWDIRLQAFERDAWVETVLRPGTDDLSGYLERRLTEAA